jgi:DNA-binding transcriptional MerR regulator
MLRHYEKCGLLYPTEIDKFTGYRYYSAGQIPLLTNIVTLRDMGFSIDEIGDILPHFDLSSAVGVRCSDTFSWPDKE